MEDFTTCYKLLNGLIDFDSTNFFVVSTNTQTRGNSCKIKKNHILNIRDANMFHNRVINFWNKLADRQCCVSRQYFEFQATIVEFCGKCWI